MSRRSCANWEKMCSWTTKVIIRLILEDRFDDCLEMLRDETLGLFFCKTVVPTELVAKGELLR